MRLTTKGIVIKEQTVMESDRLVTLLTADYGLVRAFVRGAKKANNRFISSTSLFCYASYALYRGNDAFVISDAEPIEVFFPLRSDIEKLSLAQYFAQLALELAEEERHSDEMIRVLLNGFYLLCKGEMPYKKIKSVVELRIACLGGYMPNLVACDNCNTYESDTMYFSIERGDIRCAECGNVYGYIPVGLGVITAMRFIIFSDIKKIFSFSLPDESLDILADLTEKYLISKIQHPLSTLEFYKSLL